MIAFFLENLATLLLCGLLLTVVTGVIIYLVKSKRAGKSTCGCSCSGCAMNGRCHTK